jgi:hypothetical protein
MKEEKRIVVLFEDLVIRREVIQYAVALSQRIGARMTLLMLLPNEAWTGGGADRGGGAGTAAGDPVARGRSLLEREAGPIGAAGVPVRCEVIRGEPRSEFIKFVATHPSFHTVVWGGDPLALRHGPGRRPDHWITGVGTELSCPVVTPERK